MLDNTSLEIYLDELNKQVKNYVVELDELAHTSELKNRDYYATERLLQVLIEACIGITKHWLKFLGKTVPNDAYKSFELLVSCELLTVTELIKWRKIIGLRNALVHDYLNLEKEIILTVLHQGYYQQLAQFIVFVTQSIKQKLSESR
jgi:uncharacterized protein YutE (UPF0331/DUF86 family)